MDGGFKSPWRAQHFDWRFWMESVRAWLEASYDHGEHWSMVCLIQLMNQFFGAHTNLKTWAHKLQNANGTTYSTFDNFFFIFRNDILDFEDLMWYQHKFKIIFWLWKIVECGEYSPVIFCSERWKKRLLWDSWWWSHCSIDKMCWDKGAMHSE